MKHAYLIIAHNNWLQLKVLIRCLDYEENDIFLHVDRKAKDFPYEEFSNVTRNSNLVIYSEYKNYWGSFNLVKTELFLLKHAVKGEYQYYHLLSGMDMPIKTQAVIHSFFEKNYGKEFIHFDTDERLNNDKEIIRRTRLYHFLQNYRRRYSIRIINDIFTFFERILLIIQIVFNVDRLKDSGTTIYYGSQWFSITNKLAKFVISQESKIYQMFKYTNCSDELFIQTIVMNSDFCNSLYRKERDNSIESNMRLIDWKKGSKGSPYTWRNSDYEIICSSNCLFARKFNCNIDNDIIGKLEQIAVKGSENEDSNYYFSCSKQ